MIQSDLYSWPVILEGMTQEVQRPASGVLSGFKRGLDVDSGGGGGGPQG